MKHGLHKDVASIFDGVEIPGKPEDGEHLNNASAGLSGDAIELPNPLPSDVPESSAEIAEQTDHTLDVQSPDIEDSQAPPIPNVDEQQRDLEDKPDELLDHPSLAVLQTVVEEPRRSILVSLKECLFGSEQGAALKKRIIMTALVPVLAIALMVVLAQNLSPSIKKIVISAAEAENAKLAISTKVDWQVPDPYPTTLRDPMQFGSVATQQSGLAGLIVKGVIYSPDKPAAVVSNKIVHIGDVVAGVAVVKINPDSVEFEKDGKTWTQKVQP